MALTNVIIIDFDYEKELDSCHRNFIRGVVAKATRRYEATKSSLKRNFIRGVVAKATRRYEATKSSLKNCSMTNNT